MNKTQLIEAVSAAANLSKADASRAVEAIVQSITDTLSNNDGVQLTGFGSFSTKNRAARMGRNPQTGEQIQISASTVVIFKAGKALKESVN